MSFWLNMPQFPEILQKKKLCQMSSDSRIIWVNNTAMILAFCPLNYIKTARFTRKTNWMQNGVTHNCNRKKLEQQFIE